MCMCVHVHVHVQAGDTCPAAALAQSLDDGALKSAKNQHSGRGHCTRTERRQSQQTCARRHHLRVRPHNALSIIKAPSEHAALQRAGALAEGEACAAAADVVRAVAAQAAPPALSASAGVAEPALAAVAASHVRLCAACAHGDGGLAQLTSGWLDYLLAAH